MAKQTQIEKAIAALTAEIAVLQLAINKLQAQQVAKAPRTRKPKPLAEVKSA